MVKVWLVSAAISGFLSVALGAFGAHALKGLLDDYGRTVYEKASNYQMFHTIALLGLGILQHNLKELSFSPAGWGFLSGIIIFSGSLYLLAVTGIKWLGAITPIGGMAFLFGWAWLAYVLVRARF